MRKELLRNLLGSAFFAFAGVVSITAAWEHPNVLSGLYAFHNLLLAGLYACRLPATRYDRTGLWLGLLAAFLPSIPVAGDVPGYLLVPGLLGYALILWSLGTLGPKFGVAPADRGLTAQGPYRFIRHPMYLGELVFRLSLVLASANVVAALILALVLSGIQIWRIYREEALIQGYGCYARLVPWRFVPGVW
jgi:protein-S-isoprenylcysteine O-methyltransferase Ste14